MPATTVVNGIDGKPVIAQVLGSFFAEHTVHSEGKDTAVKPISRDLASTNGSHDPVPAPISRVANGNHDPTSPVSKSSTSTNGNHDPTSPVSETSMSTNRNHDPGLTAADVGNHDPELSVASSHDSEFNVSDDGNHDPQ